MSNEEFEDIEKYFDIKKQRESSEKKMKKFIEEIPKQWRQVFRL